jgi:hypothetical protein
MRVKAGSLGAVVTFFAISTLAGCGESQGSICQSARDLQLAVNEIQVDELTSALGPEFWQEVDALLGELATSNSDEINTLAAELRAELGRFITRLEAVNYNLVAAALDPEAAELFVTIASDLLGFASNELQLVVNEQC